MKFIDRSSEVQFRSTRKNKHACKECRRRKRRCLHDYTHERNKATLSTPISSMTASSSRQVNNSSASTVDSTLGSPRPSNIYSARQRTDTQTSPRPQDDTVDDEAYTNPEFREYVRNDPRLSSQSSPISADTDSCSHDGNSDIEATNGPRFVGHLNPEGIFLASARVGASEAPKYDDTLGFWLPRNTRRSEQVVSEGVSEQQRPGHLSLRRSQIPSAHPGVSRPLSSPHVRRESQMLPDSQSFVLLRAIYFKDIHPIFPILQNDLVPVTIDADAQSLSQTVLIQSLCLVVATNSSARSLLRLQRSSDLLTPKEFARCMSRQLSITAGKVATLDRLTCLRMFAILSLFSQLSTDDHTSAEYCARAVSYVHTMQLHLDTTHVRKDDAAMTQIFLCVWALDRLNVAFHSRPLLIHARDIGRDMDFAISQQPGCFRVLLYVCEILENVTSLYRPSYQPDTGDNQGAFPTFEDLVVKADALRCPIHLLATIEILYHSVAMLSYRFDSLSDPDRQSLSCLRSDLSASSLLSIMDDELGSRLSNFPFVPYGISLALRVAYRELRFSKTPLHRTIARSKVLKVCTLLEKYGDRYALARRLSALAIKTVRELDKIAATMLQTRGKEPEVSRAFGSNENMEVRINATNSGSNRADRDTMQTNPQFPTTSASTADDTSTSVQVPAYDAMEYNAESFDIVHRIADLPDIFEHFDSDFNLNAVDHVLGQDIRGYSFRDLCFSPGTDWISTPGISNVIRNNAGI